MLLGFPSVTHCIKYPAFLFHREGQGKKCFLLGFLFSSHVRASEKILSWEHVMLVTPKI